MSESSTNPEVLAHLQRALNQNKESIDPVVQAEVIEKSVALLRLSIRERARAFCTIFFDCFGKEANSIIPKICLSLAESPWRQTEGYFTFFELLLIEAAARGFESIAYIFGDFALKKRFEQTSRDPFDLRNLLVVRTYIAKTQTDLLAPRHQLLAEIKQKIATDPASAAKIPAVFGQMAKFDPEQNKIPDDMNIHEIINAPERSYSHSRNKRKNIYMPDMEQTQAMMTIHNDIFHLPKESEFFDYVKAIGMIQITAAKKLFPDLTDPAIPVSDETKKNIQTAFGIPYTQARDLCREEFTHDSDDYKSKWLEKAAEPAKKISIRERLRKLLKKAMGTIR